MIFIRSSSLFSPGENMRNLQVISKGQGIVSLVGSLAVDQLIDI